jgi:hypothetical protein
LGSLHILLEFGRGELISAVTDGPVTDGRGGLGTLMSLLPIQLGQSPQIIMGETINSHPVQHFGDQRVRI